MSNLLQRVITGVLLICVVLVGTWVGGIWFALGCCVVGGLVLYEWSAITATRQNTLTKSLSWICYIVTAVILLCGYPGSVVWLVVLVSAVFLAVIARRNAGWVAGGYLYSAVFVVALSLLRGQEGINFSFVATCLLFVVVWATDIGAYFCGRFIGGPKLAPRISPKKTWSGAVGGALVAILCVLGISMLLFGLPRLPALEGILFVAIILFLSVMSQLGDLGESWIKRRFNVKDSGSILPGHGGVMDRVDGLIVAAAVFYLLINWPF